MAKFKRNIVHKNLGTSTPVLPWCEINSSVDDFFLAYTAHPEVELTKIMPHLLYDPIMTCNKMNSPTFYIL